MCTFYATIYSLSETVDCTVLTQRNDNFPLMYNKRRHTKTDMESLISQRSNISLNTVISCGVVSSSFEKQKEGLVFCATFLAYGAGPTA